MILWIILAIIIVFAILVYATALLIVWIYELKAAAAYSQAREHLKMLENSGFTGAILHMKTLKIQYDYRRLIAEIERRRQFIIENMLLIGKSTLKN